MIRIITVSTCDYMMEKAKEMKIDSIIPMIVRFGEQEYLDKKTISTSEFYEKLAASHELPTTSLVNVEEFLSIYKMFPEDELIIMPLAASLSGTYQSACIAKEMSEREDIFVIDTKAVSLALALLVDVACELRTKQKTAEEIVSELETLIPKVKLYAVVDTLKYLVKGGRLSKTAGVLGHALNLKPLITLKEGMVVNCGKARGLKSAIKMIKDNVDTEDCIDINYPVYFAHANNEEGMKELQAQFNLSIMCKEVEIGSVVGTHSGPGAFGMAYISSC